jgi:hypothetical protein
MRLDHHGAPSGEGSRGIAAGDRKCQREVARAKDGDRPKRYLLSAEVGTRKRLAFRQRPVHRCSKKTTFSHNRCEEPQLAHGPSTLALHARARKTRFSDDPIDKLIAKRNDAVSDRLEEEGALLE